MQPDGPVHGPSAAAGADAALLAAAEPASQDALQAYLKQIRRAELFSADEEFETAGRARAGDFQARQAMVEHNLRLVVAMARQQSGRGLPLADLIEEGNLGLLQAIERFEPERGFRFSTYASWWIRQAMEHALMQQARLVRLPAHVLRDLNQVLRARRAIETERLQGVDAVRAEDIAHRLQRPVDEVHSLLAHLESPLSLDLSLDGDGQESLLHALADAGAVDPIGQCLHHEADTLLRQSLVGLSAREREVLACRFGLDDHDPETLHALAQRLGLTRERVRQIQIEALAKLRRQLAKQGVERDSLF
ncbi:MAG: sigma-70 family RNA polymerase sigma factor [Inhella sp.]